MKAQSFTFLEALGSMQTVEHHVIADKAGNIYTGGNFTETISIGGVDYVSAGDYDCFLAKYDPNGNCLWATTFGDTEYDEITGIALDKGNGVVISATFRGTVNVAGANVVSAGGIDCFMAAFKGNGQLRYIQAIATTSSDYGRDVAVDKYGNKYLCGKSSGDAFLAKYDLYGNPVWTKYVTSSLSCEFKEMDVDRIGNICLAGEFWIDMTVDGIEYTTDDVSTSFVMKVNSSSAALWTNIVEANGADYTIDLTSDRAGNVYVSYILYYDITIDGITYYNDLEGIMENETLIAKFNKATGMADWAFELASTGRATGDHLTMDHENHLVVAGDYRTNLVFDGMEITTGDGDVESFVLTTDLNGNVLDLYDFENVATNDAVEDIAFDGNGNMILFGFSFGTFEIGDFTVIGSPAYWITKRLNDVLKVDQAMEMELTTSIFPNPVAEVMHAALMSEVEQDIDVAIYNSNGEIVYFENIQVNEGNNDFSIDVSSLPSGMYILNAGWNETTFVVPR